jgi:hypothetical protein
MGNRNKYRRFLKIVQPLYMGRGAAHHITPVAAVVFATSIIGANRSGALVPGPSGLFQSTAPISFRLA